MKTQLFLLLFIPCLFIACDINSSSQNTQTPEEGTTTATPKETAPKTEEAPVTTSPKPEEKTNPANRIMGKFVYFADAALFFTCEGNKKYPVAMEKAYLDLEKQYVAMENRQDAEQVFTIVEGYFEDKSAMEGNKTEKSLVVTKVILLDRSRSCPD